MQKYKTLSSRQLVDAEFFLHAEETTTAHKHKRPSNYSATDLTYLATVAKNKAAARKERQKRRDAEKRNLQQKQAAANRALIKARNR